MSTIEYIRKIVIIGTKQGTTYVKKLITRDLTYTANYSFDCTEISTFGRAHAETVSHIQQSFRKDLSVSLILFVFEDNAPTEREAENILHLFSEEAWEISAVVMKNCSNSKEDFMAFCPISTKQILTRVKDRIFAFGSDKSMSDRESLSKLIVISGGMRLSNKLIGERSCWESCQVL